MIGHPPTNESVRPGSNRAVSLPDAIRLWRHLFDAVPCFELEVFTGFHKHGQKDLLNTTQRFFKHDEFDQALAFAEREDRNGREAYFSTAKLLVRKRDKANVGPIGALWADMDADTLERAPVKPTGVVKSSPGKRHCYWKLSRLIQPQVAELLCKRMALAMGADMSGWDAGQLLRIPGSVNHKYLNWPKVEVEYIDDDRVVNPDELDRILPKLPPTHIAGPVVIPEAISDDDQVVLEEMFVQNSTAAMIWADNVSEDWISAQRAKHPDKGKDADWVRTLPDWILFRAILAACGVNVQRAHQLLWRSPRAQSRADRWSEPRNGYIDFLDYALQRAAAQPFREQNATPYRSDDPTTWPQLEASIPDGPSNGSCSEHCRQLHNPREQALLRQAQLVNQVLQLDLTPIAKMTLLWLMVLVGAAQTAGETRVKTSAKSIGAKLKLSAQVVRPVLHGLARFDYTLDGKGDVFRDERGLIDLDSTRAPEAGEFARVFAITPLTSGGYLGFLEAAVARAPELLPAPKHAPREHYQEVKPPPEVVRIPNCPEAEDYSPDAPDHSMHSDVVACAGCGDSFIREVRYVQNDTPHRLGNPPPLWLTSGDTPERSVFDDRLANLPDHWPVYDRARPSGAV